MLNGKLTRCYFVTSMTAISLFAYGINNQNTHHKHTNNKGCGNQPSNQLSVMIYSWSTVV